MIHANALSNILSGDYIRYPVLWHIIGGWVLLGLLTSLLLRHGTITVSVVVPLVLIGSYVFAAFYVFQHRKPASPARLARAGLCPR
jgi:CHASE2 domain-containing sensor protein